METKKRKTTKKKRSASPSKAKTAKKEDNRVLFPVWFSNKVHRKELNAWQEAEIRAFFKDKGLKDKEEPDKYEECLKLY